jgi:hypothetical protein
MGRCYTRTGRPNASASWLVSTRRLLSGKLGTGREGISSYVLPFSVRPFDFFILPPHCLKKKGTPAALHCLRIDCTHSSRIGLAPGPLSPPTITQSIPLRPIGPRSSSSGSIDRNLTRAGEDLRSDTRGKPCLRFSTLTPHQICGSWAANLSFPSNIWRIRADLLVRTWYVCQLAASITLPTATAYSSGTPSCKRSLIELTKTIRGVGQESGSLSFAGTRRRSKPCS